MCFQQMKKIKKQGGYFEKEAPELFNLEIIRGSGKLDDPSSLLLSESAAKAYFGDVNPVNQLMKIDNQMNVKVTGVYKDLPRNSFLPIFPSCLPGYGL